MDAGRAGGALVAFSLISSDLYLLNDCLDVATERAHPSKRYRAIAADFVSEPATLVTAAVLGAVSLSLAAWITPALAGVLVLYGLIRVAYCFQLQRMPLLDLFCIASGFLLRVVQDLGVVIRQVLQRTSLPLLLRLESLVATSAFMSYGIWAAGPLLSDPEEAQRRRLLAPERTSEQPEEILLGVRGILFILLAWLLTVVAMGLCHRADLLPKGGLQP